MSLAIQGHARGRGCVALWAKMCEYFKGGLQNGFRFARQGLVLLPGDLGSRALPDSDPLPNISKVIDLNCQ